MNINKFTQKSLQAVQDCEKTAIALGAIAAGVNLVSGYPGTPSSEVLETVAKRRTNNIYVEM